MYIIYTFYIQTVYVRVPCWTMGLDGANTRLGLAWSSLGDASGSRCEDRQADRQGGGFGVQNLDKQCVLIDKALPSSDYVRDAIRSSKDRLTKSAVFGQVVCMY